MLRVLLRVLLLLRVVLETVLGVSDKEEMAGREDMVEVISWKLGCSGARFGRERTAARDIVMSGTCLMLR